MIVRLILIAYLVIKVSPEIREYSVQSSNLPGSNISPFLKVKLYGDEVWTTPTYTRRRDPDFYIRLDWNPHRVFNVYTFEIRDNIHFWPDETLGTVDIDAHHLIGTHSLRSPSGGRISIQRINEPTTTSTTTTTTEKPATPTTMTTPTTITSTEKTTTSTTPTTPTPTPTAGTIFITIPTSTVSTTTTYTDGTTSIGTTGFESTATTPLQPDTPEDCALFCGTRVIAILAVGLVAALALSALLAAAYIIILMTIR